jgi:hypothetical protein
MCAGASNASLGVKLLAQVSAVTLLPWHWPQLPVMPVCRTEFAAKVAGV